MLFPGIGWARLLPPGSDHPDGKDHGQYPDLRPAGNPACCCPDDHLAPWRQENAARMQQRAAAFRGFC